MARDLRSAYEKMARTAFAKTPADHNLYENAANEVRRKDRKEFEPVDEAAIHQFAYWTVMLSRAQEKGDLDAVVAAQKQINEASRILGIRRDKRMAPGRGGHTPGKLKYEDAQQRAMDAARERKQLPKPSVSIIDAEVDDK